MSDKNVDFNPISENIKIKMKIMRKMLLQSQKKI
jgi:hypothetical protein